jgi:hypothetical protein
MRRVLAYAQRQTGNEIRYGSVPRWLFVLNAASLAVGLTLFILARMGWGPLISLLGVILFPLQFLLVALPSLGEVLFAERVSPSERLIALAMIVAGGGTTALATWVGWQRWSFC